MVKFGSLRILKVSETYKITSSIRSKDVNGIIHLRVIIYRPYGTLI